MRWTAQRALNWALALSALAALTCIGLVVAFHRSPIDAPSGSAERVSPTWAWPESSKDLGHALMTGAAWGVAAALLVGPQWALGGLLGGVATFVLRRHRVAELTALVSLVVVAAVVVVRERRAAPLPNGGWPATFESLHGLGMFAVAGVIVGVLLADDSAARPIRSPDDLRADAPGETPDDLHDTTLDR